MRISEFLAAFSHELPLSLAMADDPVGVQVLVEDGELSTVAVAYEVNERAVAEAASAGAELIVAFHPLIYPSLKRITSATRVERTAVELIRRGIGLYIVHTAFDAHPEGTSALLARALGLVSVAPLVPDAGNPSAGMGAIGDLPEPMPLEEFARSVRVACNAPAARVSFANGNDMMRPIRRVAILGGSGMSFHDRAAHAGADVMITADVRYHGFHAANDATAVIDPGHAESEAFVADGMLALVERTIARTGARIQAVRLTEPTNPVCFVI